MDSEGHGMDEVCLGRNRGADSIVGASSKFCGYADRPIVVSIVRSISKVLKLDWEEMDAPTKDWKVLKGTTRQHLMQSCPTPE